MPNVRKGLHGVGPAQLFVNHIIGKIIFSHSTLFSLTEIIPVRYINITDEGIGQMEHVTCVDCKRTLGVALKARQTNGGTGYACTDDGLVCYECCAKRDREYMRTHDRTTLYFVAEGNDRYITNWPATLKLRVLGWRKFRHPFVREAYCGSFMCDGAVWNFKNMGDSQTAHCRRAKGK